MPTRASHAHMSALTTRPFFKSPSPTRHFSCSAINHRCSSKKYRKHQSFSPTSKRSLTPPMTRGRFGLRGRNPSTLCLPSPSRLQAVPGLSRCSAFPAPRYMGPHPSHSVPPPSTSCGASGCAARRMSTRCIPIYAKDRSPVFGHCPTICGPAVTSRILTPTSCATSATLPKWAMSSSSDVS